MEGLISGGSLYPGGGGGYFPRGAYNQGAYNRGELYPGRLITETLSSLEATAGFSNKIGISNIFFPLPSPPMTQRSFCGGERLE